MYFFLLLTLFSTNLFAENEWWSLPRSEDEKNYYYVGVAEGKEGVDQLQDKAFNKAMGELIREHFGMSIQINESAVEQLKKEQFHVVTKQSSAPLFIKGVGIVKTREKDLDDNKYRIYVKIQADKKTVAEAVKNQTTQPGNDSLNTFGESHDSKVDITIKTHPQGALIHFSHMDRRFTLQGQGDARFFLPRGRYEMVVSHPGYATVKKDLDLKMQGNEENIILDELSGGVRFEVYPDDARIVFEGQKLTSDEQRLPVGKIHKFKISHPDFFTQEIEFLLENPETLHKVVKLEPRPSTISYEVYPKNATVFVDGKETTFYKGKANVDPGRKRIIVKAPGYFDHEETIYVGTNREYPLKVVKLRLDDQTMPPSNQRPALRFDINPLFMVGNVGYGGFGFALHYEYYYISLGAGVDFTQYKEGNDKDNTNSINNSDKEERETSASSTYLTARLITPQFGAVKLFGSATIGSYNRSVDDTFNKKRLWDESKAFTGVGGGLRMYTSPRWSLQFEYFDLNTLDNKTRVKGKEQRVLAGFSYEF